MTITFIKVGTGRASGRACRLEKMDWCWAVLQTKMIIVMWWWQRNLPNTRYRYCMTTSAPLCHSQYLQALTIKTTRSTLKIFYLSTWLNAHKQTGLWPSSIFFAFNGQNLRKFLYFTKLSGLDMRGRGREKSNIKLKNSVELRMNEN